MILGFKTNFAWGERTFFMEKIILPYADEYDQCSPEMFEAAGVKVPKLHSIRAGDRWKPGTIIHMAVGVRTPNYYQFNAGIPELEKCISQQAIELNAEEKLIWVGDAEKNKLHLLPEDQQNELAINDGFRDLEQFWLYFDKDFHGQIVHWTELKYNKL